MSHFDELKGDVEYPSFVKLRQSAAGVGVEKVRTPEELDATFNELATHFKVKEGDLPIIQKGVPGDDYCVTTLFDHGRLIACMTYHNLRAYPVETGAGVLRETVNVPQMERVADAVLSPLGWHGVAQLDFRWDGTPDGEAYLIEVNPRFWGGLIQAVESGWDYPWLLFRLAAEGHVELEDEQRFDIRTETPVLALLATIQDLADSDQGMKVLHTAWKETKGEFRDGSKRGGVRALLQGVKDALDMKTRFSEAKRLFQDHEDNVYDVLSSADPMPALGVLYPLAVFLRHGKVNMELLTGESGPSPDDG